MRKIITLIFILIISINYNYSFGEEINSSSGSQSSEGSGSLEELKKDTISGQDLNIEYKKNIAINEPLKIDLSHAKEILEINFPEQEILFEWNIKGEATKNGYIFEKEFEKYGDEEINLNIYTKKLDEKKLIINLKLDLFIYEKSIAFLFNDKVGKNEINDFIKNIAAKSGLYIYNLGILKEKDLNISKINDEILKYKNTYKNTSNYTGVRGEKDFLFSVISKLNIENTELNDNNKVNLVLVSPFNTTIIQNYLNNLVSEKSNIGEVLLIDISLRYQIISNPLDIKVLETYLIDNQYDYLKLNTKSTIEDYFFISKFINNLSNKGFTTTSIYIVIIIPFLFTLISFSKHFIGISPIGTLVPIFLVLLFMKIGIMVSSIILILLIIFNLFISKITNKYTLLYTPKISFIITINFILFIIAINVLSKYSILDTNLTDSVYILLFIIISEKLITIIISKEFKEYNNNLINTFFISLIGFYIFNIDIIKTIILSYPEIIILLIPINFIIGRFTGLRVTEYFRFREVIKNIEE